MNTFWKKGYSPTSVSDLSSAMSITRSSFYNSFESRESVFREALAKYQSDNIDAPLAEEFNALAPSTCLFDFFRAVCQKLAADPLARGCLIINCYAQSSETSPPPEGVQAFIDGKIAQFQAIIAHSKSKGLLPPDTDSYTMANTMLAFLIGLNILGKTCNDEGILWASAENFLTAMGFEA